MSIDSSQDGNNGHDTKGIFEKVNLTSKENPTLLGYEVIIRTILVLTLIYYVRRPLILIGLNKSFKVSAYSKL